MSSVSGDRKSVAVMFGVEWPTVLVLVLCWSLWFLLTLNWESMHPILFAILSSMVAGWHASFQHEAIHGHPTKSERVNRALAMPSITLWLPFEDYRTSHLAHHVNENLTDPDRDPESYYIWQEQWLATPGWKRQIMKLTNTLVGRLTIGASLMIIKCVISHAALLLRGDKNTWKIMARHILVSWPPALIALILFEVPIWLYFLGFQFGSAFWMSLRSFLEHEAAEGVGRRTAIVWDGLLPSHFWFTGFFSLIFLNNNLHVAHHLDPRLPWYELPKFVEDNRDKLLEWNEGNQHDSYAQVAMNYGVKAKEPVAHPLSRASS